MTKKSEEGKRLIEDNSHVIEWLHKQLNADALSRPLGVMGGFGTIDFEKYTSDYTKQRPSPTLYRSRYPTELESRTSPNGIQLKYTPYQSNSNPTRLNSKSPPKNTLVPPSVNSNSVAGTGIVNNINVEPLAANRRSRALDSGGTSTGTNTVNVVAGTSSRWQVSTKSGLRDEMMGGHLRPATALPNGIFGNNNNNVMQPNSQANPVGNMINGMNAREEGLAGTNRIAASIKSNYF